jgi:hypothetical protein
MYLFQYFEGGGVPVIILVELLTGNGMVQRSNEENNKKENNGYVVFE